MASVSYRYVCEHLAEVWDDVEYSQTPIRIERRGHHNMALIRGDELASLQETAQLLRSPKNAARLLSAMARSTGRRRPTVERRQLGIDAKR